MVDQQQEYDNNGVMIALIPTYTDWCNIDLPHVTLVYAGQKDSLQPGDFNDLAKDAASLAMLTRPFSLLVKGIEIFGEGEQVKVLKLQPTSELLAMRRFVESWNKSQHPFNPHATIGPYATSIVDNVPRSLSFDRIMVAWGLEQMTFWLNTKLSDNVGY